MKKGIKEPAATPTDETKASVEKAPRTRKAAAPKEKAAPRARRAAAPKEEAALQEKSAPKTRRTATARTGKEVIIIQAGGGEWDLAALKAKVMAAHAAGGHRASKNTTLYVKPEERKVYYVIGKYTGSVDFE